jgi:hypothetical protein
MTFFGGSTTSAAREAPPDTPARQAVRDLLVSRRRGLAELGFVALVYVGYAASRVLADESFAPARERAMRILSLENAFGLDVELDVNRWFHAQDLVGLLSSFYYAGAHYVVTLAVLVWLYHRRPRLYVPARQALVAATFVALAVYLLMPTAPPRLVEGYTDLMSVNSASGWWGGEASAPQGLGWLTNQLAAFPSMHAGWALWVALVVRLATRSRVAVTLAWLHALATAAVVVGTGNHWLVDVVVGWALVAVALVIATATAETENSGHPLDVPA